MARTVLQNNKGVTIIETMVSLLILLVVSLALMKTSILGMQTNVRNALRTEATDVIEKRISQLRSLPFPVSPATNELTAIVNTLDSKETRTFRGYSVTFTQYRTVTDLNADTKQLTISTSYIISGQTITTSVTTIL